MASVLPTPHETRVDASHTHHRLVGPCALESAQSGRRRLVHPSQTGRPLPKPPQLCKIPLPQQPDRTPLEESDLRPRFMRFLLPEDDTMAGLSLTLIRSLTVDVGPCVSGVDVLRKVLEEFGVREAEGENSNDNRGTVTLTEIGGLIVDGWGTFPELEGEEGLGEPLSEPEVLSVCHAPPTSGKPPLAESGGEEGSSQLNYEPVLGSTLHLPLKF
ncbi:hypothetical protein B0H14DRAFT_2786072 [Mycena olivaceomarginata]|nr:hypothetical protein B0H14DRAFT_2786072 [Mycena olivaceomarginata]